jgi:hypothetical protein
MRAASAYKEVVRTLGMPSETVKSPGVIFDPSISSPGCLAWVRRPGPERHHPTYPLGGLARSGSGQGLPARRQIGAKECPQPWGSSPYRMNYALY